MDATDYPFGRIYQNKIAIPSSRNCKQSLTEEEVVQIIQYEPLPNNVWARDMWLLSFYCNGMNMVDIFSLKWSQINGDFIYFIRKKTKNTAKEVRPIEVFIIPQARTIIERWAVDGKRKKDTYVFGIFDEFMTPEEKIRLTALR